jgi:Holliday junction resolvasome RuvABC endonuclease subunit
MIDSAGRFIDRQAVFARSSRPGLEANRVAVFAEELTVALKIIWDTAREVSRGLVVDKIFIHAAIEYPLGTHKGAGGLTHEAFGVASWLFFKNLDVTYTVSPYDIKRFMTGKAKADKAEIMHACTVDYKFAHMNNDGLADAFAAAQVCRWLYAWNLNDGNL